MWIRKTDKLEKTYTGYCWNGSTMTLYIRLFWKRLTRYLDAVCAYLNLKIISLINQIMRQRRSGASHQLRYNTNKKTSRKKSSLHSVKSAKLCLNLILSNTVKPRHLISMGIFLLYVGYQTWKITTSSSFEKKQTLGSF